MPKKIAESKLRNSLLRYSPPQIHREKLVAVKDKDGYIICGIGNMVYVDEDIAELVELLNKIDGVETYESCQGYGNERAGIWLAITPESDIFNKARELFNVVEDVDGGWCMMLDVSITWSSNKGNPDEPTILLEFEPRNTQGITEAIREYVKSQINKRLLLVNQ